MLTKTTIEEQRFAVHPRFCMAVSLLVALSTFNPVSVAQNYQDYQTWNLPDGAIARLGKGRIGGGNRAVAFSPDGERLAVATTIGVWLYDVSTSRELSLLTGGMEGLRCVAFSPDGSILAAGAVFYRYTMGRLGRKQYRYTDGASGGGYRCHILS